MSIVGALLCAFASPSGAQRAIDGVVYLRFADGDGLPGGRQAIFLLRHTDSLAARVTAFCAKYQERSTWVSDSLRLALAPLADSFQLAVRTRRTTGDLTRTDTVVDRMQRSLLAFEHAANSVRRASESAFRAQWQSILIPFERAHVCSDPYGNYQFTDIPAGRYILWTELYLSRQGDVRHHDWWAPIEIDTVGAQRVNLTQTAPPRAPFGCRP